MLLGKYLISLLFGRHLALLLTPARSLPRPFLRRPVCIATMPVAPIRRERRCYTPISAYVHV
jgi:hypothetical protein